MNNNYNNWSNPSTPNVQNGWFNSNQLPEYRNGPSTNVIKVTSLNEAVMQSVTRMSETVYFHQDKNEFYNVRVDANGNKSWQTFNYNLAGPAPVDTGVVTKEMYDALIARISALEEKHKEVSENAQSNG
jgi:hypothetical protein